MPGGQRGPPGHQAAVRQLRPHRRGQLGHRLCAGKQGQDIQDTVLLQCAMLQSGYPGVYARVAPQVGWILDNIRGRTCPDT